MNNIELKISIQEEKLSFFIQLLKEFEYIDILEIKEEDHFIPEEHKILLEERLRRIEDGNTTFKSWDLIKEKYVKKAI